MIKKFDEYITENNTDTDLLLENKFTDFFKKFNLGEIKSDLKKSFGITEEDSKEDISNKLGDYFLESNVKSFKYIVSGSLGYFLGYLLQLVTGLEGETDVLKIAGALFFMFRAYKGYDTYKWKTKSPFTGKEIKNYDD